MKGTEIVKEYKRKRNLRSIKAAEKRIEVFWETLVDALKKEKKLAFKGWGSFEVKEVKERIFNNPKTKERERIPTHNKIIFKQGKLLKERFNKQGEE